MSIRPYQLEGVEFLAARQRAILGDEPGLGKSAQVILAAEKLGLRNILIVCPAIGRVSWPIELSKWDMTDRHIIHVGKDPLPGPSFSGMANGCAFLVSYDLISRGGPVIDNLHTIVSSGFFSLLVLDEGQYLKDTASKRTRFVYTNLVPRIPRTWVLSGTLTPNHNGELYPHVRGLFPNLLGAGLGMSASASRTAFEDHYCKVRVTTFGRQIVGNRNTTELRTLLAPHFLRRRVLDVLRELPPLTIEDYEFNEEATVAVLSPEQLKALDHAREWLEKAQVEADDRDLSAVAREAHLSTARRALGLAKVPLSSAWALDLLESGQDKLIVFAHHQDVVSSLAAALLDYAPVVITGSTSTKDRVDRVDRFQTDPNVRVLVGNIQAAGSSITLTASNRVGIVEPSWVPGENAQAIRRSYRLGQKRPVVATFLSVGQSLDATIAKTLIRKARDIAMLLDPEEEEETA